MAESPRARRFEETYLQHRQAIAAFAMRRCGSPEDAADIVASTFLTYWRRLDAVSVGEERLWLFGVAKNCIANHRRSDRRQHRLGSRLAEEFAVALDRAEQTMPGQLDVAAAASLNRLSGTDAELLRMTYWDDLASHEVAHILSVPNGTARSRISRARRRFKRIYKEEVSRHE